MQTSLTRWIQASAKCSKCIRKHTVTIRARIFLHLILHKKMQVYTANQSDTHPGQFVRQVLASLFQTIKDLCRGSVPLGLWMRKNTNNS